MKAIGLLSGGLDSTLAVRLVADQGLEVIAVKFTSPFCQCDSGGCCHAAEQARRMGVALKVFEKGEDYLLIVRHPRHGWGAGMNPCIDCRIFMLRKAKAYMEEIGAAFLFTGEVLGQRPMSQHRQALELIEREAGLEGQIVRPLSAQLFQPTEAERNGWIDRTRLLALSGRNRKPQIALAAELGVTDYPCPAGGCLLTDAHFAAKLRDLFAHQENVTLADIRLLKLGRHFRVYGNRIVCGRNAAENEALRRLRLPADAELETADVVGPTVLLRGAIDDAALEMAAAVAAAYSDATAAEVTVRCRQGVEERKICVPRRARADLQSHLIANEQRR
jgi:tRNA U34 2-thiouridine synthase MnmA/TrmU